MRTLATDSFTRRELAVDDADDLWTRTPGEEWKPVATATIRRDVRTATTQIVVAFPPPAAAPALRPV